VEDLSLRVTRLRGDDGTVWFVPNGEIRILANLSRGWAQAMVDVPVPAASDVDTVLGAVADAAAAVTTDDRYAASCLAPPMLWGVVATDADTITARVSIRTTSAERGRLTRALREEIARRLHAGGVFGPPDPPASGAGRPAP
jgi:small conductance mechanosensitive channel